MKHGNSIKAALAATALAVSISAAQAQVTITAGGPVILPYSYYGPAYVITPQVNYTSPFVGYGYDSYDANGFGYGQYGNYGLGYNYGAGPGAATWITPQVNQGYPTAGGLEVNGDATVVNGNGVVTEPSNVAPPAPVVPYPQSNARDNAEMTPQDAAAARYYRAVLANPVVVQRAPYNHINITYRGSTANVSSISMQILDRHGRALSQAVLNGPPAATQLRRLAGSRFYRVILTYNDGTTRTLTHTLPTK
jgi:hypothetical protein